MTKIVIGCRFKGGQATSTTLTCLLNGLTARGKKALLLDLDEQGNSTITLGGDTECPTMWNIANKEVKIAEAIQHTPQGYLIGGNTSLKNLEKMGIGDDYIENLLIIKKELHRLTDFDYILIDTPPRISGFLIESALTAAHEIIIPIEPSAFSAQGLPKLQKKIEIIRQYTNNDLKINGVLLTRFNPRLILSGDLVGAIKNWADMNGTKIYENYIRESVAVKEAQARRMSLFDYAPECNPAQDYMAWIAEYLKEIS
jgi:chromosome partitioning protein